MAQDESYWNDSIYSVRTEGKNVFDLESEIIFPQSNRSYQGEVDTLEDHTDNKIVGSSSIRQNVEGSTTVLKNNDKLTSSVSQTHPLSSSSKEQAEVNFLKRKLTEIVLPSSTVLKIVWGYPYSLECYKSREHKLELLNEAIKTGDGNAILTIVLFLERTMKKSLFNLEIGRRPMALDHYIHHLLGEEPSNNMFDVLKFFSRSDNAAMLKFKLATKDSNASSKVASLKKCLESHFQKEETLQQEAYVVQQYIDLIELQCAIQENYRNEKNISNPVTPKISDGFVGSATMSTLSYSCLYHYDKPENFFVSPLSIKKSQKLTDKQYLWKAMIALIIQKRWNDLESLFKTKTWMGGIKMRSPVSFDRIVSLLHHMNAPKEIKEKYCVLVEDLDQRIQIASKCSCHEIVLKTYKDQLNRCQIEEYMTLLKNNTPEYFLANELLNDTSIKWKK